MDNIECYKVDLLFTTKEIRKKVQEIAFKKGYGWTSEKRLQTKVLYSYNICNENFPYIFLEGNLAKISCSGLRYVYDNKAYKEITIHQALKGKYNDAIKPYEKSVNDIEEKFDTSKILSSLNADEAIIGKNYYFSDSLTGLKSLVENDSKVFSTVHRIIHNSDFPFVLSEDINQAYEFLYPMERNIKTYHIPIKCTLNYVLDIDDENIDSACNKALSLCSKKEESLLGNEFPLDKEYKIDKNNILID